MGTIWIKELTGGLDARRLPETTPGGVLIKGNNGHITRGGEFEKRAAFVPEFDLPAGTVGMAFDRVGIVVFGSGAEPAGMPSGVGYQQLVHPVTPALELVEVLSYDRYAGKLYVVARFSDGSIFHFYDGVYVEDWYDGRARASFTVTDGRNSGAIAATATLTVVSGSAGADLTALEADGVSIIPGPVSWAGDIISMAAAIADAINSVTTSPNYTATSDEFTVTVTPEVAGPGANGRDLTPTAFGSLVVNSTSFSGGADPATSTLDDLRVNGVSIINAPVEWDTTAEVMAADIAAAVNSYTSTPDYDASSVGAQVNIVAVTAGTGPNGYAVTFDVSDELVLTPDTGLVMANGSDSDAFTPATFVKTVRTKMYATADSLLHYSGVQDPTGWTTDVTGAGFIDMATEDADADELVSLARYQNQLAVFGERVTLLWYIDPDPTLNTLSQTLANTGTRYARSVTQFGDADVFYLDSSGLRSLRARDSSNAAATTDIGVSVDSLINEAAQALPSGAENSVIGLINPRDKRFWLCVGDTIFVFSFYENAKVSAWTTYEPGFTVEEAMSFADRVWVRSGDTLYAYGGAAGDFQYDSTQADVWLPYLDANRPTSPKDWTGVDVAVKGTWRVAAAMDPTNEAAEEEIANVIRTSYNDLTVPMAHPSTHIALRFSTTAPEAAILSAAVIHYAGGDDEK